MKIKSKKMIAIFLAVIAMALASAMILSACDMFGNNTSSQKKDKTTTEETKTNTDESDTNKEEGNTQTPAELDISFDDEMLFSLTSLGDLSDALQVEIVSGSTKRSVDFSVKSSELSADGKFIDVVIVAEGVEKSVRLPYAYSEEAGSKINTELMPLYELMMEGGEKAFTFRLEGKLLGDAETAEESFALKAVLNVLEDNFQVALFGENDEVLALYKDNYLNIGGLVVSAEKIEKIIGAFTGGPSYVESDFDYDYEDEDVSEYEGMETEENGVGIDIDADAVASFFEGFSSALNSLDTIFDNKYLSGMNIGVTKENGVYSFSINSRQILAIVNMVFDPEEAGFELDPIIDAVDEMLDGALKKGNIVISLSLGIENDGINATASINNNKANTYASLSASLSVANKAVALPEVATIGTYDVAIDIPFSLPQNDVDIAIKAVIHTSDMFVADGRDIVTVNVDYNEIEDFIRLVLNDNYLYVDISDMATMLDENAPEYVAFYQAFEINGEPVSIFEYMFDNNDYGYGDEPYDPYTSEDEDDIFGYGYSLAENLLPIGTTEEQFREMLEVTYTDRMGEDHVTTDYELIGFDSSESAYIHVIIRLSITQELSTDIIIYNPENARINGLGVDVVYVAEGTTVGEVQEILSGQLHYTDGTVYWEKDIDEGITITMINNDPVTEETVFNIITDDDPETADVKMFFVIAEYDEVSGYTFVNVYDPENLEVIGFDCDSFIYLYENDVTEEQIRTMLDVSVKYDNNMWEYVTDYEIVGYEFGVDSFEVTWGDYSTTVTVSYVQDPWNDEPYGPEPENNFDPTDYLRFIDKDADFSPVDILNKLKEIIDENKDWMEDVIAIEETDNGGTVRLVINTESDVDLFAIINLFFGIPGEEGWIDIDEELIMAMINGMDQDEEITIDIPKMFESIVGVELGDFLSELYAEVSVSCGDAFVFTLRLDDGAQVAYLVTGVSIRKIAPAAQVVLTEEEIDNTYDFETFGMTMAALLFGNIVKK